MITRGNARIEDVVPGRRWRVTEPMIYLFTAEDLGDGEPCVVAVPAGFEHDLASIPRVLGLAVQKFDLSIDATILHDYLYRCKGIALYSSVNPYRPFTRALADRLFYRLMLEEGVSWWKAWTAYRAVRAFGGAWGRW